MRVNYFALYWIGGFLIGGFVHYLFNLIKGKKIVYPRSSILVFCRWSIVLLSTGLIIILTNFLLQFSFQAIGFQLRFSFVGIMPLSIFTIAFILGNFHLVFEITAVRAIDLVKNNLKKQRFYLLKRIISGPATRDP